MNQPSPEQIIKNIIRKEDTCYKHIHKIEKELEALNDQKLKQETRLSRRIMAKQNRCKHGGPPRKSLNCRDDASFKYWLFCGKCGKEIGHEGKPDSTPYG